MARQPYIRMVKNIGWSFGAINSHSVIIHLRFIGRVADKCISKWYLEVGNKMDIIVCDDNRKDRETLIRLLKKYELETKRKFKITEYDSGCSLYDDGEALKNCRLIFLNINMAENDGLKTAMRIKETYPQILVVLISAHMDYALDGYKVKASRFLLKNDLEQTLKECMDELLKEIHEDGQTVEFQFVGGRVKLRADEIIYVETDRHKNLFYTKRQVYSIYKKLDEIEEELKGMGFVRIHLSFLVNMRYVEKISSYIMRLTNGKEISVSKPRYPEVKRQYTLFKEAQKIKL